MRTFIVPDGKRFAVYLVRQADLIATVDDMEQAKRIEALVQPPKPRGRPPGVKSTSTTTKKSSPKGNGRRKKDDSEGGKPGRRPREIQSPLNKELPIEEGTPAVSPDKIREIVSSE